MKSFWGSLSFLVLAIAGQVHASGIPVVDTNAYEWIHNSARYNAWTSPAIIVTALATAVTAVAVSIIAWRKLTGGKLSGQYLEDKEDGR